MTNENIFNSLYGLVEPDENDTPLDKKLKEIKKIEEKIIKKIVLKEFNCLDIGFNYGWFSYNFLKNIGKNGNVYAWEPNNFLYESYLKKWPFKNLIGYNFAVSDREGIQKYYIYGYKGERSGLNSLEKKPSLKKKIIKVQNMKTIKLDDWWEENSRIKIDIIKIDCEGHDYKVLLGADNLIKNSRPTYIWVEQKDKTLSNFMNEKNYTKNNYLNELGLDDVIWTPVDKS